ncbi:acyltransferase [Opitutaceae bacterium TAV5]|nr:acyltransferase [Opitutaceae bacterium TAV5]
MTPPVPAFSPCVIIPCYNHGGTVPALLAHLAPLALPVIVVDDGSDAATAGTLRALAASSPLSCVLLAHPENRGKGAATATALREALRRGFSHAIQIDADGQHDPAVLPAFVEAARANPRALVSGRPVYDGSIPRSRRIARHITHAWVRIETLSLQIRDSMCGLRVYPVAATLALIDRRRSRAARFFRLPAPRIGRRMDFDIDIMVRLFWKGVPVIFLPVRVTYPPGGISHFRLLRDNLRISWLHTRLVLGMIPRAPGFLLRRLRSAPATAEPAADPHWSRIDERRGLAGMRLMFAVYRLVGYRAFALLLHPVAAVFWLTGRRQRRASRAWLRRLRDYGRATGRSLPRGLNSYRHFYRFGEALLEKLAAWSGDIRAADVEIADDRCLAPFLRDRAAPGVLVFVTHLGNAELCRALGARAGKTINAIVFTDHAARFNRLLREIAPDAHLNLVSAAGLSPATAIRLKEKIDAGEWVAIAADRTAVLNPGRTVTADFLGAPAPFPEGPFVLASVLECPVFLMFALRENGRLRIHVEPFAHPLRLPRATRAAALAGHARRLAARIEHHAANAPLDWFNFYDFWQTSGSRPPVPPPKTPCPS